MIAINRRTLLTALAAAGLYRGSAFAQASGPLPSWSDRTRQSIIDFVGRATRESGPDYVASTERIATFDNDGTLWCEKPLPVQAAFALDRIKAIAPQHPEWKDQQPFKAVLEGNPEALLEFGEKGIFEILATTHSGMTTDAFSKVAEDWFAAARHPRFGRPYTELAYQPMQELLTYLRTNGFKTFIVSGGGVEFMRVITDRVYGIPPEQVVGSSGVTKFEIGPNGTPVLMKEPKIQFVDDGPGKPEGIDRFIGRRPIFAFGNSDGDWQMLQWTAAGAGVRFMGLVHHTDAEREYAYAKQPINTLDKALDEANAKGWMVVDMKNDWRTIFPAGGVR
jgi:phosphoglycolate phosphatase-like HAD superfamily hydrolase